MPHFQEMLDGERKIEEMKKEIYPAISIIIPTFNRPNLLIRAMNSLIAQTFVNWEAIVVDDGSEYRPGEESELQRHTLHELIGREPRIKYMRIEHTGRPASVINRGAAIAQGNWITCLSDDDEFKPNRLQDHFNHLSNHPDCQATTCWTKDNWVNPDHLTYEELRRFNRMPAPPITKRKFWHWDEAPALRGAEDWDFYIRLASKTEIHRIPKVGFVINMSPDSISKTIGHQNYLKACLAMFERQGDVEMWRQYRSALRLEKLHLGWWPFCLRPYRVKHYAQQLFA